MEIKKIGKNNFNIESLDSFDRFQIVKDIYSLEDGKLTLKNSPFTEDWSPERRREKAAEILSGNFITCGAFEVGRVVGELMIIPEPDNGRLIIKSFHVSREYRHKGIGRALFLAAEKEAFDRGADALYASACSAEETIEFYLAMGFHLSANPIKFYTDEEPFDIQMEYNLFIIRPFELGDENDISYVICRTLEISNAGDYTPEDIKEIQESNSPEKILKKVKDAHFYVVMYRGEVIGCGGIIGYWGSTTESYLFSIFVLPEYQGRGIGKRIIDTLESDEYFIRAWRTEIGASITAVGFYRKMGYKFKNGITEPDANNVVRMEKLNRKFVNE